MSNDFSDPYGKWMLVKKNPKKKENLSGKGTIEEKRGSRDRSGSRFDILNDIENIVGVESGSNHNDEGHVPMDISYENNKSTHGAKEGKSGSGKMANKGKGAMVDSSKGPSKVPIREVMNATQFSKDNDNVLFDVVLVIRRLVGCRMNLFACITPDVVALLETKVEGEKAYKFCQKF
ncbi:hypothetical protein DITRI_Ditri14bG0092600 [Diplodiscus trichospermus]